MTFARLSSTVRSPDTEVGEPDFPKRAGSPPSCAAVTTSTGFSAADVFSAFDAKRSGAMPSATLTSAGSGHDSSSYPPSVSRSAVSVRAAASTSRVCAAVTCGMSSSSATCGPTCAVSASVLLRPQRITSNGSRPMHSASA
jgi:hypothetical protein